MTNPTPPPPEDRGIWFTLWTVTKITVVLMICAVIAIFMLTSTDSTVTPAAPIAPTTTRVVPIIITGPTPTSVPTTVAFQDAVIPGHLFFVKGSTIYKLHGADPLVPVAVGRQPAVSRDGSHLAYVLFEINYQDLYTLNLRTSQGALFVNDKPYDPTDPRTGMTVAMPAWSDDGNTLYFSWSYPGAPFPSTSNYDRTDLSVTSCPAIGTCNTSTGSQISHPNFETGGDYGVAPRPLDPTTLVYTKWVYQQVTNGTYYSIPQLISHSLTDGSEITLTQPLEDNSEPSWNPTGRYLAFIKTTTDQQHSSIWVMPFHPPGDPQDYSRHATLLVAGNPFAAYPVFSPDGHYLAFLRTGDDNRLHLYIGLVHLGKHPSIDHIEQVKRAGIVDGGERLAWAP